jgi:hypothetical protein
VQKRRDKQHLEGRIARRMNYAKTGQAWRAWRCRVGVSRDKQHKLYCAIASYNKLQAVKAFRSWVVVVEWREEKRRIVQRFAPADT